MSQIASMVPIQGGAPSLKASSNNMTEGSQSDLIGEKEGLTFIQTLQELTDANPNAAAILLALHQSGVLRDLPLTLQTGGSSLPSESAFGGNPLPQSALQRQRLENLPGLPVAEQTQSFDHRQLQLFSGDKPLVDRGQLFPAIVRSGLAADAPMLLENRGLADFSTQLQGLGPHLQSGQAAAPQRPLLALPVQLPVGQPGWDNAVGERIQWMISRNVQQAEIKLTPPELGPMEIKISLQNDQTSVHFAAHHSATRDALEAAIPRLRELFGEINLNLANVDVSQRQDSGTARHEASAANVSGTAGDITDDDHAVTPQGDTPAVYLQSLGLVDTYA